MLVDVSSDVELFNGENMTKIKQFINATVLCATIILCVIPQCLAALSDKQLCYDPNCSEPISLAKTILSYTANDHEVMSFGINADVKVFSKGAGKRTDLWGVEINGKRGFAPKSFLKEITILKRDLLHEVPVYKFDGKTNKVQPKTLQSTEKESSEAHLLKDKLSDDNGTPLLKSIDESITEEPHTINADSVSHLYEVIDGTTVYVESDPSVQPSFVTKASHASALPSEQTSVTPDSERLSFDKNINNKELYGLDTDDSNKFQKIQSLKDIQKEPSSDVENLEPITTSTIDTASKDKISTHEESKEELITNIEHAKELESSVEENVQDDNGDDEEEEEEDEYEDEEEEVTKNVENVGIFASITNTLKIFSSEETVTTKSTTIQDNDITSTPETVVDSKLHLEEQDAKIKNDVTEKILPPTETKIESNIDQSFINKEDVKTQQEIIHTEKSVKTLNDKIEEAPIIILENTTSPSDVPSNNFVHENADKPAKELSIEPLTLTNNNFSFKKVDIDNHSKNIKIQKSSEAEKVVENVTTNDKYSDKEDSILSNSQEAIVTTITVSQSSNDIEQKLSESNETNLENTSKDFKETVDQVDKTVIPKDSKLYPNFIDLPPETIESIATKSLSENQSVDENVAVVEKSLNQSAIHVQINNESVIHSNVNNDLVNDTSSDNVPIESNEFSNSIKSSDLGARQSVDSSQESMISEQPTLNDVLEKQDLSSIETNLEHQDTESQIVSSVKQEEKTLPEYDDYINNEDKVLYENEDNRLENPESTTVLAEMEVVTDKTCIDDYKCETVFVNQGDVESEEDNFIDSTKLDHNYWKTLIYLCITAFTTLVFTLGYYYIENIRRDGQLIARINKLEKELLVSTKECEVLSEDLKSTKDKLHCIEDKSFGSNEMVVSLKADLATSQSAKVELEEQVTLLEKDLENATEAGLEIERMLREVLASNNEVNPLAQSVEDLQSRLDAQQTANESLTNALNLKAQEIETLTIQLASTKKKYEELEVEYMQIQDKLTTEKNLKNNVEQTLTDTIHTLEKQVTELSTEKLSLHNELKSKEIEVKELMEIINQLKSNNLDLEKLYDVSHIKIEAVQLREERDELKARLNDVEGAHQLLEEHMKLVKEEISALSDQCNIAEKEKKDAETRLEVLSKFFQEKETERQKEEAIWLQKQGEVVSTVERLHMMQNEIQNYKQQVEILKREIMDQEREYKNQISALETKAHEQWVAARQNERRLEESKAEAGQLRNRLTLIEKSLNDIDPEAKLHRLEANGETATSPPLFVGAESSSSPVMFSGSSGVPPPPLPSYLHFPPYLPPLPPGVASGLPPYDISQRPPPLGGRLSSPPPMLPPPALHRPPVSGSRYENAGSPPPPMSPPHILPPFDRHRSPPPPFGSDHIPPLPPPGSILPPPLGGTHPWGEDSLPHPRNSGFHPHQREQRARNHKGSLHSSGESLDKVHHGKV